LAHPFPFANLAFSCLWASLNLSLRVTRLIPAGTYKVQGMLQQGGWGCAQGGYTGVFTPMWLMVARKPLS